MRHLLVASVALPLVVLAAVAPSRASTHDPAIAPSPASSHSPSVARAQEVHRLQVRLDSVLSELSVRDVHQLSDLQRARRGAVLATLRVYRDEGQFPHNYDFPGEAVPYFVDRKTGVLCAVGYLLDASGRRDIVDHVAA